MMTLFLYGISSISPLSKITRELVLHCPNSPLEVLSRSHLILVVVVVVFCKKKCLELKSSVVNSVLRCNYM